MEIKKVKTHSAKYPVKKCVAVAAAVVISAGLSGCKTGNVFSDVYDDIRYKMGLIEPSYDGGIQYAGNMTYVAPDDEIDPDVTLSGTDQSATDISCTDCEQEG